MLKNSSLTSSNLHFIIYNSSLFTFLFLLFLGISCRKSQPIISPAFYYWQTELALDSTENQYLTALNIQKVYVKFFDIDWDYNMQIAIVPATLVVKDKLPSELEIIPTIFITNRTFLEIPKENIPELAEKTIQKINSQIVDFDKVVIKEIQLDCDWTAQTKEKYFYFLEILQKKIAQKNWQLSATIRLHQVKYHKKTGVPPIQRGLLMYYNMGNVQETNTENSILDNTIGQNYLENLSQYPLPLDVALPVFQWGVLFRNDKMIKLVNQLKEDDLKDNARFSKIGENKWKVLKNTYLTGYYLYENDWIRLEKTTIVDLKKAAILLQKQLKKESRTLVFYHLDSSVLNHFEKSSLTEIVAIFNIQ